MKKLTISEELSYSTVFLQMLDINLKRISSGTGFIVRFPLDGRDDALGIVTNKHNLSSADFVKLIFCKRDDYGNPLDEDHFEIVVDLQETVIYHPDVDLCILPIINYILNEADRMNQKLFIKNLDFNHFPTSADIEKFDSIEDVLMVGYPYNLWDQKNNKPIARKGITATDIKRNWLGQLEFLIDIAVFKGNSGSPVFILMKNSDQKTLINKLFLIGILRGSPNEYPVYVYNNNRSAAPFYSLIPGNVGVVIKSSMILEMQESVKEFILAKETCENKFFKV